VTAGAIGDDYDEALRVVRATFGALEDGDSAPSPQPLALDDLPVGTGVGSAPRLIGFGRMAGVGAVAPDEELRFAPDGLTIIWPGRATWWSYTTPRRCAGRSHINSWHMDVSGAGTALVHDFLLDMRGADGVTLAGTAGPASQTT
jgi:hypothetical protein